MTKTVLNEVFDLLVEHRLVNSESEFSRDWLGRSESYMRGLRFHNEMPSAGSIAICASKLQHYGARLDENESYAELAHEFLTLSQRCHNEINKRAQMSWLPLSEMGSADQNLSRVV